MVADKMGLACYQTPLSRSVANSGEPNTSTPKPRLVALIAQKIHRRMKRGAGVGKPEAMTSEVCVDRVEQGCAQRSRESEGSPQVLSAPPLFPHLPPCTEHHLHFPYSSLPHILTFRRKLHAKLLKTSMSSGGGCEIWADCSCGKYCYNTRKEKGEEEGHVLFFRFLFLDLFFWVLLYLRR